MANEEVKKNNAKLYNLETLIKAGIDPKTGLPLKVVSALKSELKNAIKRQLRIIDEQDAVRRYTWYNLPSGLDGELIERILYYKGQAAFFYMKETGDFYFLPYALDGTIDVYGRFKGITPLPFNGTTDKEVDSKKVKPWITGLIRNPIYNMEKEVDLDMFENGCVILEDYTKQVSQNVIPRATLQEGVIDAMAEAFPLSRTNLIMNSGVRAMRVNNEDEQQNVTMAAKQIEECAIAGQGFVPIIGTIEFQDLTNGGSALKSEEFLLYMQALDNYRLSTYGLKNGGLFQKKSHMLEEEQNMNEGTANIVYEDGLLKRQRFCDFINYIWGLGVACLPSESVIGADTNGDGVATDEIDQSGQVAGEQPVQIEEGE